MGTTAQNNADNKSETMIEMKNVCFGYGKDVILSDVNLTILKNEYVGIIGANGAGKSTLMKIILGQLVPNQGSVCVNTEKIGYVPQVGFYQMSQFPANVLEVVLTGLYKEIGMFRFPKKEHKEKAKQLLELVGMKEYQKRMLSELSGGQQQRVMIARALVSGPELLVLDEPLTGIDQEAGEELYQILNRLHKEYGMTIVMVTHNMEQVARFTNRFYHVRDGSVHLDKSSVLCDEVMKQKMIISRPKKFHTNKGTIHKGMDLKEVEEPYDASYKGNRRNK
ncbi:MAG: metal ABC transporter ATP-binding protein [Lachnospiraceae bacterium]